MTRINILRNKSSHDSGSAIIEFLVIAIPLFVPLVWFITSATDIGVTSYDATEYARNLLRVYVTTSNSDLLQTRLETVTQEYRQYFYPRDQLTNFPSYSIDCESDPCLTPGNRVTVTVNFHQRNKSQESTTTSSGYVDEWSGV